MPHRCSTGEVDTTLSAMMRESGVGALDANGRRELEIGGVRARGPRPLVRVRRGGVRLDPGRRAGRVVRAVQMVGPVPPAERTGGVLYDADRDPERRARTGDSSELSAIADEYARGPGRTRSSATRTPTSPLDSRSSSTGSNSRRAGDLREARRERPLDAAGVRRLVAEHRREPGRRQGRTGGRRGVAGDPRP